jgi:hypothetical protein
VEFHGTRGELPRSCFESPETCGNRHNPSLLPEILCAPSSSVKTDSKNKHWDKARANRSRTAGFIIYHLPLFDVMRHFFPFSRRGHPEGKRRHVRPLGLPPRRPLIICRFRENPYICTCI